MLSLNKLLENSMIRDKYKKMCDVFNFVTLLCIVFFGCTSTKNLNEETRRIEPNQKFERSIGIDESTTENFGLDEHLGFEIKTESIVSLISNPRDSLTQTIKCNEESPNSSQDITQKELGIFENSEPESAVSNKIVDNYLNSKNREPGGHCLMVSKTRFEKAYEEVNGHSVYEDLPDSMATSYYTPREVFDFLYVSASGIHEGWRSLPIEYRGKGNAGAIAYAGMGTLVNAFGIWSGKLKPGAMMQVWKHRSDYEKVVNGTNNKDFDPFGHSFIFIGYVRNEKNEIIGIRIADQGYQSYRPLLPDDYEVWWAVNLSI